ncbi:energy transducer TonB [Moraxella bovis]|uniref:energy transducer TonB n=1 Tax=Moraxella bovis TaxID=476 RepID=UPI0022267820|nr:energy transducer TonB [Moraxella bovis]UYZ67507.1 energy transducer TonB [Moraxella bovis]UYZ69868.1 energy transducer TonB [Moraxella bovis]UYZ74211.1 energy transducer TonB [Moraxella bovis]UZA13151.1 energy transducer TonB [Moraxella bovis]UZA28510.1 energy transducer TonB [Moraxella bovis]
MMTFEHSNKYKVLAAAVAIILHGVAGLGLATMQMLHIEPPKITPPLEIQMIKLNNEESPEPPKPEPKPMPIPAQSVAAPAPPKASPPPPPKAPKPEPRLEPQKELPKPKPPKPELKQEPVKLEPKEPPKVTEPQVDIIAQERAQKAFELQQQREREQREREQQERERQAERDRQAELARQQAERDRQAKLARQKAEADAKARAEQGQGRGGDGKDTKTDNKTGNKDTTKSGGAGGGELKGQNLSISNASWKSKPNWNGLTSEKLSGSANFVATLTIDANGKITSVSGVNTGDKGLDRQISQALRRARLHPFKSSSGQPMSGTATFSTTVQF